jgi:hypothetical protein
MIKFKYGETKIKHNGYVLIAFRNKFILDLCRSSYEYVNDKVVDTLVDVQTGGIVDQKNIVGIEYIDTHRCYEENDEQLVTISITCPNCKTYMNFNRNAYVTGNPSQYFHVCPKCHTQALVKISTEFKKDERSI